MLNVLISFSTFPNFFEGMVLRFFRVREIAGKIIEHPVNDLKHPAPNKQQQNDICDISLTFLVRFFVREKMNIAFASHITQNDR